MYVYYTLLVFFQVRVPFFQGYLCLWNCVLSTHLICSLHWSEFVCPNLPACFCPQVGSYWDWPLHVFRGRKKKSFSPPHRVLSGLFGFVWPRFRSSFEIWFTKENKGGGKTTFDSPFFQGCAFSFLLMSVLSELWPITIATSYTVNLLIRIFLGTRCFSIFYTTCVSWPLFRP